MTDENGHHSTDGVYMFEQQQVVVGDLDVSGHILDIGGGGEGVIGKLMGSQVVAIDPNRRELEEAAPGPLKIVMDARELQFLDQSFQTATAFFSLMYIKAVDHAQVFAEVFRVLAPGARFLIWEVILPECLDEEKPIVGFPLLVKLPGEEISTGYGTRWPERVQDLAYYRALAESAGFEVVESLEQGQQLFLELRKAW